MLIVFYYICMIFLSIGLYTSGVCLLNFIDDLTNKQRFWVYVASLFWVVTLPVVLFLAAIVCVVVGVLIFIEDYKKINDE